MQIPKFIYDLLMQEEKSHAQVASQEIHCPPEVDFKPSAVSTVSLRSSDSLAEPKILEDS